MENYDIIAWWSEEDAVLVAEAADLAGCMAHRAAQEEVLASVREAIVLWIEVPRAAVDPKPVPLHRASDA